MTLTRNVLLCCLALLPGTLSAVVPAAPQQSSTRGSSAAADAQSPVNAEGLTLSEQVAKDVMEPLRIGIVSQNIKMVLSVFDPKEMTSYADLQQQLNAFYFLYNEVRFRYQLLQVEADKDHGSATAEIDMDALPYQDLQVPVRRSVQMHLQLKLEPKGWKVTGFSPAGFFGVQFDSR